MVYTNVELHNTAEFKEGANGAVLLQRVPEGLRQHLNPGAQDRVLRPGGGEIRFVSEGGTARVTLSALGDGPLRVVPFFGSFLHGAPFTVGAEPKTFEITMSERFRDSFPALEALDMSFSPRVCRLMLWGAQVAFHRVEGDGVRPPTQDEVPQLRYLSYGTSITHGASASWPHLSYVAQVARRLGADLLNFGVGGSCHCESQFADYFAARDDWHFATLALSVNMMGFGPDEFRKRVTYLVNTVAESNLDRPVACITLFSYYGDEGLAPNAHDIPHKAGLFRDILRQTVGECPHPNVHLLEGRSMLADYAGLTTDLIHPADDGMIEMGENIARALRPLVAGIGA